MIYLACPYSSPDPAVREARFQAANRAAARLVEAGYVVFSPISMSHPIEQHMGAVMPTEFWCSFDEAFMAHCTQILVLKVDGWDQSRGVMREIAWFKERGIPARFLEAA